MYDKEKKLKELSVKGEGILKQNFTVEVKNGRKNSPRTIVLKKLKNNFSEQDFHYVMAYLATEYALFSPGYFNQTVKLNFQYDGYGTGRKGKYLLQVKSFNERFSFHCDDCRFSIVGGKIARYKPDFISWNNIEEIRFKEALSAEEMDKKNLEIIKKARYDEMTWSNITEVKDVQHMMGKKLVSIKDKFDSIDLQQIENAFEKKSNIIIRQRGEKRDYTVETKMCEDGVFRAWYSSEYSGCWNGDYYILLNPTQAFFVEPD